MTLHSPEVVPTVRGDGLLASLHHYNVTEGVGLAYRGSHSHLQKIRAETPCWEKDGVQYPDSDVAVVCASSTPLMPTFYALAPREDRAYFGTEAGGLRLILRERSVERFHRAMGCVAVLWAGEGFTTFTGGAPAGWPDGAPIRLPELRSTHDQVPLFNVEVSIKDFWQLFDDVPLVSLELVSETAPLA